ncbi:hypothetical protein EMPS_01141 [Entomortierella parvispora]|uniref:N-acetyltransferase domain-containing protein n=1 Tax=Entomortierella parvispora TaxID=205924 RepID=A0A9P3H2E8_9FUNG|nr:hypothetical protein EMPS_01141 [Entomortierella parvispora]
MTYSIRFVETPQDLALCHEVRYKVFTDEQGYDGSIEVDDIDSECKHWVVVDSEGHPVGTARIFLYSPTVAKVGRVAVLSSTRGSGLGRLLMESIEKWVIQNTDVKTLALSSQVPRMGFYERMGFVASGDIYPDEGQPHIYMEKPLSKA